MIARQRGQFDLHAAFDLDVAVAQRGRRRRPTVDQRTLQHDLHMSSICRANTPSVAVASAKRGGFSSSSSKEIGSTLTRMEHGGRRPRRPCATAPTGSGATHRPSVGGVGLLAHHGSQAWRCSGVRWRGGGEKDEEDKVCVHAKPALIVGASPTKLQCGGVHFSFTAPV